VYYAIFAYIRKQDYWTDELFKKHGKSVLDLENRIINELVDYIKINKNEILL
jgi:hypothetical protein